MWLLGRFKYVIVIVRPGVKTVRFPEPTDVVDLFSTEILGRGVTAVKFPMRAYETRVMITGNADAILAALKEQH